METGQSIFNIVVFALIIAALMWAWNEEKNR